MRRIIDCHWLHRKVIANPLKPALLARLLCAAHFSQRQQIFVAGEFASEYPPLLLDG
jgi:hypothetical protein